jgi:hypothetical protein
MQQAAAAALQNADQLGTIANRFRVALPATSSSVDQGAKPDRFEKRSVVVRCIQSRVSAVKSTRSG